ncbi:MAG: S8 family peptidase [Lachnospiraceae bacterium]|nr:S8 family peptidase [Lachnospiraceae bacterium]
MSICREAVISNDYKGFGLPNRGSDEEVQALLRADCVRRVSENLVFAYFYYPEELRGGREYPFGIMQKCYGLLSEEELAASGVLQLRESPYTNLYGSGVLLGFVDTGINFADEVFRNEDGSTKLLALWDQTLTTSEEETAPNGEPAEADETEQAENYAFYGREFSREQIDTALQSENSYETLNSRDEDGHGSAVVRAASAVAPLASVAMVKLKQAKPYLRDFFQIPENAFCAAEEDIIYGVEWLLDLARREQLPLVLCIALGSNQGNHTGRTVLSRYLDSVAQVPGVCVCTAAGNEGGSGHHFFGRVTGAYEEVELSVGEGVGGFTTELWAVEPDLFTIEIISPAGEVIPRIQGRPTFNRQYPLYFEGGTVRIQSNLYDQTVGTQGIWIRFEGTASGVWRIRVYAEGEFSKEFHMWLPITPFLSAETAFLRPDPYTQICDPGAAREVLTFTAYDVVSGALHPQASYGYTADNRVKPDLAAPQGEERYAGTGLATAFGAGSAALVFEAAIRNAEYVVLDTLVMKRVFTASAERENREYPNREWGYGKLDVYGVFVRAPGRE